MKRQGQHAITRCGTSTLARLVGVGVGVWLTLPGSGGAGEPTTAWKYSQACTVAEPGMIRMQLPLEILDHSRPGLEDLRVTDERGEERPYALDVTESAPATQRAPRSVTSTLAAEASEVLVETGTPEELEGLVLETGARAFIKAVHVQASENGTEWREVARGVPVFREAGGASNLRVSLPKAAYRWLRLTIDDRRAQPVAFTGARLLVPARARPTVSAEVKVLSRVEDGRWTRLEVGLPAANLRLSAIELDTTEPVFTRDVRVKLPSGEADAGTEREWVELARGTVFRLSFPGQAVSTEMRIPIDRRAASRSLVVEIDNQDSPPLAWGQLRVSWSPVQIVFRAREAGVHRLLTGNPLSPAPRYDLSALAANWAAVPLTTVSIGPVEENRGYRPATPVPEGARGWMRLDTSAWKYRRKLALTRAGVQELELDAAILAHARRDLGDLRLVSGTNQVPYLLEPVTVLRAITPEAEPVTDARRPQVSRWRLRLPYAGLPVTRLECTSPTQLFERHMRVEEEVRGPRGDPDRRTLATGWWRQTPGTRDGRLTLDFTGRPETGEWWLETDNGDNAPLVIADFRLFHSTQRMWFQVEEAAPLWLYYGNPEAGAPRYDLALMKGRILAAEKAAVSLEAEEQLKQGSWAEAIGARGLAGPVFFAVLGLVVVGLLGVVIKLVPAAAGKGGGGE